MYQKFARELTPYLTEQTGHDVQLQTTRGSVENAALLREGKADLAILQAGAVDMVGLVALAPLYPDVVHVIVRHGRGIRSIKDLAGRSVSLGPGDSGMRKSAADLLDHYGITIDQLKNTDAYFLDLKKNPTLEAAIVTTGFLNPDLIELLDGGKFRILPVRDAEALSLRSAYFSLIRIPRGLYSKSPAVPAELLTTVTSVAFLATRRDASKLLVQETLRTLYEHFPRTRIPTLIGANEAAEWSLVPMHPAARAYHEPYKGLDTLAKFINSLAGIKELLFTFGAGLYLLWVWWRQHQENVAKAVIKAQKGRMDALLEETVRIERAQMTTQDPGQLKQFLDDVTNIKLKALEELTHEDLRGDRRFSIFLTQCGNLIRKIQGKLMLFSKK